MKNVTRRNRLAGRSLPALAVVGGSLASIPAAAVQLGDITVQSRLGQPLRASIAFALAPNEQVANYCITLRPGASLSGLPNVGNATVSVANGVIMLSGQAPLREPMVSAHIVINCPYSANLSREYMLFIDPVVPAYEPAIVTQQHSPSAAPVVVAPAPIVASVQTAPVQSTPVQSAPVQSAPVQSAPVRSAPVQKDITPSTTYSVKAGETLSEIAQRIENRNIGLWAAVDVIFAANPQAFINNDRNLLKQGSVLSIPSFDGNAAVVVDSAAPAQTVVEEVAVAIADSGVVANTVNSQAVGAGVTTDDLQPGSVAAEDNPFVNVATDQAASATESIIIPDTSLEGPATASDSPNVATAIITSSAAANDSVTPSWILWLAGSGAALILGLLMFGRRLRNRPDEEPFTAMAPVGERRRPATSDFGVQNLGADDDTANVAAIDAGQKLNDDSPTEENIALQANLVISNDLEDTQGTVAPPDFGFSQAPDVEVELPFEPVASISEQTDILPTFRTDEFTILDSEVFPEDDDIELSAVIDIRDTAKFQELSNDGSNVVPIIAGDETMMTDSYTINDQASFQVLEQDYEDELSATQVLNKEIERAAAEIAKQMDSGDDVADETTALPRASVTELDITAQMPAQNDAESQLEDTGIQLEDTGITQALQIDDIVDDATVEMPAKSGKSK